MNPLPSKLAAHQQALIAAISHAAPAGDGSLDAPDFIAQKQVFTLASGLNVYKNQVAMLAPRVLRAAYPVCARLLGEAHFGAMARALWRAHPPQRGDLAQWGEALPGFMECSPALAQDPAWPDLARVEWALHLAATASDAQPDPQGLNLLIAHAPDRLWVQLAPGTALLHSAWPLAGLLNAQRAGAGSGGGFGSGTPAGVAQPAVPRLPPWPQPVGAQDLVVWRQGFAPCVRACLPGEAPLLRGLLAGRSLGQALQAAPGPGPALDFGAWLAQAYAQALWITARTAPA